MQTRTATPERWARAFDRAAASGVVPTKIDTDRYAVKSATRRVYYMVQGSRDGLTCTCKAAAEGDEVCWHRAAAMRVAVGGKHQA